jgi:nucleoid-associated protein YgaU
VVRPGEAAAVRPVRPVREVQPARSSRVRLTRRGRLSVFVASLATVLSLGIALGAGSVATEQPGTPTPTRTVVVAPGDTLWGIAGELAADGEVRTMVERIERLNALDTALVQSGQRLRVPLTE